MIARELIQEDKLYKTHVYNKMIKNVFIVYPPSLYELFMQLPHKPIKEDNHL